MPEQPSSARVSTAIVVAAHGSRAEAANRAHRDVVDALADALSADPFNATVGGAVTPAFLELAEPTIPDAIDAAAATGVGTVLVVPYFLHPGRHLSDDLPAIIDAATARHPGIEIRLLGSFGAEPGVLDILAAQVTSAITT